jgi:hypothetical protein
MRSTNMKYLICTVLLALGVVSTSFGQAKPEWITDVENTVRKKEAGWKLNTILGSPRPDGYSGSFRLTAGNTSGSVTIQAYTTLTNPIETFEGLITITGNTLGKGAEKVTVPGLGDEGYLWARSGNQHSLVEFRKGRTFVQVYMPGKETALRIARHVLEHIP